MSNKMIEDFEGDPYPEKAGTTWRNMKHLVDPEWYLIRTIVNSPIREFDFVNSMIWNHIMDMKNGND